MTKVNIKRLDSVTSNDTTATTLINDNFQALQEAIENTLSRDGSTPNFMDADLDMNSYRIINSGDPTSENDLVTLKYIEEAIGNAASDAQSAADSAVRAASSAQSALVSATNAAAAVRNAEETIVQATELLNDTQDYVDDAKVEINQTVADSKVEINQTVADSKVEINQTVADSKVAINQYVLDAEDEVRQIATDTAQAAVADAAEEATQIALGNLQPLVDSAADSASSANASKNAAASSATSAQSSANSATSSKNAAASSATSASGSANNAKIWAEGTDSQVQALGGSKSAKGWAEASTNLDYTNITNCITAIPQDIKLELNNGTLTLKAGSKVYIPNGVGKFDEVTTSSDYIQSHGVVHTKGLLLLNLTGNTINGIEVFPHSLLFSGTSQPSGNLYIWYNTNNNIIKNYTNGVATNATISFPIAEFTGNGSQITSIKVFNGFGYIGSTIFALPGVEGLIPNGFVGKQRNNTKFTTTSVLSYTRTSGYSNYSLILNSSSVSNAIISYNSNKNNNVSTSGNLVAYCNCGTVSADSTGRITSFKPKTVFQATDYYDFKQLDDSAAKLGENNVFTGVNTFERAISRVYIKSSSIDITSTPSSTQYSILDFYDKNNQRLGVIGTVQFTTGEYGVYLQAGSVSSLNIRTNGTSSYTSAPTPATADNSTQIATTAFVNNKFKVVSTLPASPDANVFYFIPE